MKKDFKCVICHKPASLPTEVKKHNSKTTLGACSRPHQAFLRMYLVEHGYEYNGVKGRYEK
jgi:transcription elongation factor Elf1